jgi:hypothetical protein
MQNHYVIIPNQNNEPMQFPIKSWVVDYRIQINFNEA